MWPVVIIVGIGILLNEFFRAKEEKIPVVGMHIKKNDKGPIPPELKGKKVITLSWDTYLKSLIAFSMQKC